MDRKADGSNRRSLCILPMLLKLTERSILGAVSRQLITNDLLSQNQHGFVTDKSNNVAIMPGIERSNLVKT